MSISLTRQEKFEYIANVLYSFRTYGFDSQKAVDAMLKIADSTYASLNIFDINKKEFRTAAIAGIGPEIDLGDYLGFDPLGVAWFENSIRTSLLDSDEIILVSFRDLTKNVLLTETINKLESEYGIEFASIIKIHDGIEIIGDFNLMFRGYSTLEDADIVKLFAYLIGLMLSKENVFYRISRSVKESEEKYKALVESSFAILYELSEQGLFTYISPAWTRLLGHSVEEAIGRDFRPYVHPEDLEKVEKLFKEIKSDMTRKQLSGYRLKSSSGEWRWFETNSVPLWDNDGKEVIGYAGTARDITELVDFASKLKSQHDELERFFAVNLDLLCIADMEGRFLKANLAWETTLGYPMDVIVSSKIQDLIHPEDMEATYAAMTSLKNGETVVSFTNRYRCADGSYKMIEWRSIPYENLIYGSARDITESKKMEENLYIEKELFRTTLLSVGDGVISTDREGRITIMNHVAESLTGWKSEEAVGKNLMKIFEIYQEGSAAPYEKIMEKTIESDGIVDLGDIILSSRKGFDLNVEVSSSPIKDRYGFITGVVIVFRDFTEKREKHREVEYLSFHDHLTGLYNRRYMEDSIARLDTPRNIPFSVLMLDVNGLKLTNDIFGHGAGDELIRTVARILLKSCRADDIVCRVGGDEFAVLLPNTDPDSVEKIKNRIADAAAKASLESIIVSISVGYAAKKDKSRSMADVLKDADDQMYRNKLLTSEALRLQIIDKVLLNIYTKYDNEKSHSERVSRYSREIAVKMGLEEKQVENLRTAGLLHDIGKITMPPNILNKNGKLTDDEYEDVKRHSGAGYRILRAVDEYAGIAEIVLYHHERPDGKGYPMGLKGDEIPLESRIIAVADAFEAMTSARPYREKFTTDKAIFELRRYAGTQFDLEVVEVFVNKVLIKECGDTCN